MPRTVTLHQLRAVSQRIHDLDAEYADRRQPLTDQRNELIMAALSEGHGVRAISEDAGLSHTMVEMLALRERARPLLAQGHSLTEIAARIGVSEERLRKAVSGLVERA